MLLVLSHFFFFNDTATTEIYTLSLHDALPIYISGSLLQLRPSSASQSGKQQHPETSGSRTRRALQCAGCRRTSGLVARAGGGRLIGPPPNRRKRFLLGPDLIERVAFKQFAVFHHIANGIGVMDVLERIFIQNDQVSQFAWLQAAYVLRQADHLRAVERRSAQHLHGFCADAGQRPHLPLVAQALQLPMAADANVAAGADDLDGLRRQLWIGVLILSKPSWPPLGLGIEQVVGRKEIGRAHV